MRTVTWGLHPAIAVAAIAVAATAVFCALDGAWALDVDATMSKAEARLDTGDFDGALRAADAVVTAAGSNPEAYHCRFRVYLARAQDEDALADINRAIELAPANAKYLAARGELHLARHKQDAALKDLDAAIDADDAYAPAYRLRAQLYVAQRRPELALGDAMKAVDLLPDDAAAYVVRGDAFSMTKEYAKACTDYVKATKLGPECAETWRALAVHKLRMGKEPRRAIDTLDRAIALEPLDASSRLLRAKARLAARDESLIPLALEDLAEAIRLDPDNCEAYLTRAVIERQREEYASALADLRRALALEPKHPACRQLWDTIHKQDSERLISEAETFLNKGKYDEAAARVEKTLEIDPTSEAFQEALQIIEAQRKRRSR